MPCSDCGRETSPEEYRDAYGYTFHELEDAFCSACTALEEAGVPIPPVAAAAWATHKVKDDKRRAREDAAAKVALLRRQGLNKLSPTERDALGLR